MVDEKVNSLLSLCHLIKVYFMTNHDVINCHLERDVITFTRVHSSKIIRAVRPISSHTQARLKLIVATATI